MDRKKLRDRLVLRRSEMDTELAQSCVLEFEVKNGYRVATGLDA